MNGSSWNPMQKIENILQIVDRISKCLTIVIWRFNTYEWNAQMPIQVEEEAITDRLTSQAYEITLFRKETLRKLVAVLCDNLLLPTTCA